MTLTDFFRRGRRQPAPPRPMSPVCTYRVTFAPESFDVEVPQPIEVAAETLTRSSDWFICLEAGIDKVGIFRWGDVQSVERLDRAAVGLRWRVTFRRRFNRQAKLRQPVIVVADYVDTDRGYVVFEDEDGEVAAMFSGSDVLAVELWDGDVTGEPVAAAAGHRG